MNIMQHLELNALPVPAPSKILPRSMFPGYSPYTEAPYIKPVNPGITFMENKFPVGQIPTQVGKGGTPNIPFIYPGTEHVLMNEPVSIAGQVGFGHFGDPGDMYYPNNKPTLQVTRSSSSPLF